VDTATPPPARNDLDNGKSVLQQEDRSEPTVRLLRPLAGAALPAGKYRLLRLDRYSLKIYTIGHYTQATDAESDRSWWQVNAPDGVYWVAGG
jgi:hypothetical protein